MKLVLDFDDVLFNARAFKELMFQKLEREGFAFVREVYKSDRQLHETFSLKRFLKQFVTSDKDKLEILYEETLLLAEGLENKEVTAIVRDVGAENCFVVTHGDEEFQRDKIKRVLKGIVKMENIVVVSGSKEGAIKQISQENKSEDIIFVDDKVQFLNNLSVEELPNVKTVLFNHWGLETLQREIEASREDERKRGSPMKESSFPKMK